MATEKENIMQMIKELPDDITLEDIIKKCIISKLLFI